MPAKPALDLSQVLMDLCQHCLKDEHMLEMHLRRTLAVSARFV